MTRTGVVPSASTKVVPIKAAGVLSASQKILLSVAAIDQSEKTAADPITYLIATRMIEDIKKTLWATVDKLRTHMIPDQLRLPGDESVLERLAA